MSDVRCTGRAHDHRTCGEPDNTQAAGLDHLSSTDQGTRQRWYSIRHSHG